MYLPYFYLNYLTLNISFNYTTIVLIQLAIFR